MGDDQQYRLDFVGERVRSAAWGSFHLNVYTDAPQVEDLERLAGALRELRDRVGRGGIGVLTYIVAGFELPGSELRRRGAELQAEMNDTIRASAVVIDGGGFWVSAAISVVSTIQLVARPKNPSRTFSDLDAGAAWLAGHMEASAEDLIAAVRRLHAEPG